MKTGFAGAFAAEELDLSIWWKAVCRVLLPWSFGPLARYGGERMLRKKGENVVPRETRIAPESRTSLYGMRRASKSLGRPRVWSFLNVTRDALKLAARSPIIRPVERC